MAFSVNSNIDSKFWKNVYLEKSKNLNFKISNYNSSFRIFGKKLDIHIKIYGDHFTFDLTCKYCGLKSSHRFQGVVDWSFDTATETFTIFGDLDFIEGQPPGAFSPGELRIRGETYPGCPDCESKDDPNNPFLPL